MIVSAQCDTILSVETSTVSLPDGDTITVEVKTIEVRLLHQYKVSLIRYEQWHQGALVATELQQLTLRWYGIEELRRNSRTHWFLTLKCTPMIQPESATYTVESKIRI